MKAFVVTEKAEYEVPEADRLKVTGDLVEIQRAGGASGEYETVAVVGTSELALVSLGVDPSLLEPASEPDGDEDDEAREDTEDGTRSEPW